ncbi:GTP-binding protein [Kangiella aquimarina]|uniref:GTPase n=1 Tax=Kangiella aquimarina TaxID=261965 RepID=A0ABZ0X732_9GAMM|nr:GTPase [Kangiella aquimarina]WQG86052.1 GTPase [Kangiella aquimarina]
MYRKLVVIGDVGAGKSTLIRTLSEIETVDTDVTSSKNIGKPLTTVGIDYGRITLGEGDAIGLYGVPGQKRYSFIWDMVKEDIWACILLVKAEHLRAPDKLIDLINVFINDKEYCPLAIGVTHTDIKAINQVVIQKVLQEKGVNAPVFSVDARKKQSSLLLLHTLLSMHNANDFSKRENMA